MKNALIDIGSNTIRLAVYDGCKEIENRAVFAGLIEDVKDGILSDTGLKKITDAVSEMKRRAEEIGCADVTAFATASLRGVCDKASLVDKIKEKTGVYVRIISGEAEARYDFLGLKSRHGISDGAAFDLGGGSCQLMMFESGIVRESGSLPIGSLRLHGMFSKSTLPTEEERIAIRRFVRKAISDLPLLHRCGFNEIYGMGGASHALSLISQKLFCSSTLTRDMLLETADLDENTISSLCPQRLKTIVPAALTIYEIMKYTGADTMICSRAGVRDGLLSELAGKA